MIFLRGNWISLYQRSFKEKIERREKLILSESGNEISMVYFSIGNNFVPVDKLFFFFSRGEMNFVNKIDDARNHLWGCKIYVTLMFYYAKGRKEL